MGHDTQKFAAGTMKSGGQVNTILSHATFWHVACNIVAFV